MKDLTPAALDRLSERFGAPVVLVIITARNPSGELVARRYASRGADDGSGGYRIGGVGDEYEPAIVALEPITRESLSRASGEIVLANPTRDGDLVSEELGISELDGAQCEIAVVFADGDETPTDRISLACGVIEQPRVTVRGIALPWRDCVLDSPSVFPREPRMSVAEYPHAPKSNQNRLLPVVFGDLRGRAFDVTTPESGAFPHVPVPTINTARQRLAAYDATLGGARELLLRIGDHVIEVPDTLLSAGSDYVQVDGTTFHLWTPPCRVNSATDSTVIDPEYASGADLDRFAHIPALATLALDLPGVSSGLGLFGAGSSPSAEDVVIYTVYTKTDSGDVYSGRISVLMDGSGVSGHTNIALGGAGLAVDAQEIGDHLTDWSDLQRLSIHVDGVAGTSGVDIRRVLMRVWFQCADVGAAFERQRFFRSMAGFTESATDPLDDYRNGTYLHGARLIEPVEHPADITETILRNRVWGFGLTASSLFDTGADLDGTLDAAASECEVTSAASFGIGDYALIEDEVVRVTDIDGTTLSIQRGVLGSRLACHPDGVRVYIGGSDGAIDSMTFRAARSALVSLDAAKLVANESMEGAYASGLADDWSAYDPDGIGTLFADTGCTGHRAQGIFRTSISGADPGVSQSLNGLLPGERYCVECFAKSVSGASAVRVDTVQSTSFSSVFPISAAWTRIAFDVTATDATMTLRIRNAGGIGSIVIDAASVRLIRPWRMAFSLDDSADGQRWLEQLFLPQSGMRLGMSSDEKIAAVPMPGESAPVATLDETRILVAHEPSGVDGASDAYVPAIRARRGAPDDVAGGVAVRYAPNRVTSGYDGFTGVSVSSSSTDQSVVSVSAGTPLDTLHVTDSAEIVPKAGAAETANITTSGDIISFPSGDLVAAGVIPGDWLVVTVSHGTYLHRVAELLGTTQARLVDRPPYMNEPGHWSVSAELLRAGGEVFCVCETPNATTATIIRNLDANAFPTTSTMQPGDAIHRITARSDDGTGARDQHEAFRDNRERLAIDRLARYGFTRTIAVDAPYIRDRHTAIALRDRLFDDADRVWIVDVATDLSTLALEVGDSVIIEHDVLPGGILTGVIARQSVDVLAGRIDYAVRCTDT